jgi:hypothetical protein
MQQLTKSLGSFTWAMSLFGLQQTVNLFRPVSPQSGVHPATAAFQSLTDATVGQLGNTTQRTFQVVDGLQRQLVDVGLSIATLGLLPRGGSMDSFGEMAQRTMGQFQQCCSGTPAQPQSSQTTGWGPVPTRNS